MQATQHICCGQQRALVSLFFFFVFFLRSGEICVRSVKDYDPGAHLSFGDVLLDSTVDPQVAQVSIKAS